MTAGFCDFFSRDPAGYARFRPRYPAALSEWLATLPAQRRLAWDCATGTGQAAAMLAAHFDRVVGTDASLRQLQAADRARNLSYVVCLGESSPLAGARVDLITVAQALHWLDHPRFFAEVERVAAPGGALAVWGYNRLEAAPEISEPIRHFQDVTVGPYWPPERKLVDRAFRGIALPIEEMEAPRFAIEADLPLAALLGYLRTWSAVTRYREAVGRDPVELVAPRLARGWGEPQAARPVRWPLFVRAGKVKK